ncbi:MAG: SufD family Fe-S cluster assembly protein [Pseudomonadota bacterium]
MNQDVKRRAAEAQLSAMPLPEAEASWAREARAAARTRLLEAGAPVRRDEYWKYTNPDALTQPLAAVAISDDPPALHAGALAGQGALVRFVNGTLREDLSDSLGGPAKAVTTLSQALSQDISIAREIFGALEAAGQEKVDRPLAALNTATATEGLVIQVTGEATPMHAHYQQIGEGSAMVHHLIRVEAGGSFTLIETGVATNTVLEVDIAEGGAFNHIRTQTGDRDAHATHLFARLAEESALKSFTLTADGSLTRNEVVMDLVGDNASGHVAGAILAEGQTHTDNTVFVTHTGVDCESRQVFKNVLGGTAKGIFQGKIYVREGAQKTDGYQISQAVLLNDGAEFSAKPELEIYADDVACSHGSTTGALDPTAMFYLQSRGVTRAEAEAMLIAAFADEAIEEIEDEALADLIRDEVAAWMAKRG